MECHIPYEQWPEKHVFDEYIGTHLQALNHTEDNSEPAFGEFQYMETLCYQNKDNAECVDVVFRILVNVPKAVSNQFIWQLQKKGWKLKSNKEWVEPYREYDFYKRVTVKSMKLRYDLQERLEAGEDHYGEYYS